MSKYYQEPKLIVHKYNICQNIFTSGDKLDDDIYDITVNANNNDGVGNEVFGD